MRCRKTYCIKLYMEQPILHVLNRGVDKRDIFLEKRDYLRFIYNLYVLNDEDRLETVSHTFKRSLTGFDIASRKSRKLLVDIFAFCLMPNHYHILIAPRAENGVPMFMRKLNMAYAKYFNKKYERVGTLFQSRYKSVPVENDAHFDHLPFYIHFNPLDLSYPEWRENKISNPEGALEFLKSYRWSSHLDYLGTKNFPLILNASLLNDVFNGSKGYEDSIREYLKDTQIPPDIALE